MSHSRLDHAHRRTLAAVSIGLACCAPLSSRAADFSEPRDISSDVGTRGALPSISHGTDKKLHISFGADAASGRHSHYRALAADGSLSSPVPLVDGYQSTDGWTRMVFAERGGQLFGVDQGTRSKNTDSRSSLLFLSSDGGVTFSGASLQGNGGTGGASLVVDHQGIHLAFTATYVTPFGSGEMNLYYQRWGQPALGLGKLSTTGMATGLRVHGDDIDLLYGDGLWRSTDAGKSLKKATLSLPTHHAVAAGHDGSLYLVHENPEWYQDGSAQPTFEVRLSRIPPDRSKLELLTTLQTPIPGGPTDWAVPIYPAIDVRGPCIAAVWTYLVSSEAGPEARYSESCDFGATWSDTLVLGNGRDPWVAIDHHFVAHVVFASESVVYRSRVMNRPPVVGDSDGDGAAAGIDCDDGDPEIDPFGQEIPGDGKDNDCDPVTLDEGFSLQPEAGGNDGGTPAEAGAAGLPEGASQHDSGGCSHATKPSWLPPFGWMALASVTALLARRRVRPDS